MKRTKYFCLALILLLMSGLVACGDDKKDTATTVAQDSGASADILKENNESPKVEKEWVQRQAPQVRVLMSQEEKDQMQKEVLNKGTALFSSETNTGYYPEDISWLTSAKKEDYNA